MIDDARTVESVDGISDFGGSGADTGSIMLAQAEIVPPAGSDQPPAAPAMPAVVAPDANNVVRLPAEASIDDIRVDGADLVLVQADGTEIRITGGALRIPTFVIGDVEVPQETLVAALEANDLNVAAGPDGLFVVGAGTQPGGKEFEDLDFGSSDQGPTTPLDLLTDSEFGSDEEGGADEITDPGNSAPSLLAVRVSGTLAETADVPDGVDADPSPLKGTIDFADADFTGGSATVVARAVAGQVLDHAGNLTQARLDALLAAFSLDTPGGITLAPAGGAAGSVAWTYAPGNAALDFLRDGESVVLEFVVTISDGIASTTATVAITVTGTNDAPVFTAVTQGTVDEEGLGGNDGDDSGDGSDAGGLATVVSGSLNITWGPDDFLPSGAVDGQVRFTGVTAAIGVPAAPEEEVPGGENPGEENPESPGEPFPEGPGPLAAAELPAIAEAPSLTGPLGTSRGEEIQFVIRDGGETIIGYVGASPEAGRTVFRATIDEQGSGTWNFQLLDTIDHVVAGSEDDIVFTFDLEVVDSDGLVQSHSFSVSVDDDAPRVVTPELVGGDTRTPAGSVIAGEIDQNASASNDIPTTSSYDSGASSLSDRWVFFAEAGQQVTVHVARGEGAFDPALWVFSGRMDDETSVGASLDGSDPRYIGSADDSVGPALPGPWADPQLTFTAPTSGYYTVFVTNVASGTDDGDGVFPYTISVSGNAPLPKGVHAVVDEDDLAGIGLGNEADGDAARHSSDALQVHFDGVHSDAVVYRELGIAWGADDANSGLGGVGDRSLRFDYGKENGGIFTPPTVFSRGEQVQYEFDGTTLRGFVWTAEGERDVFTVTLSDLESGMFRFELLDVLDHPRGDEDDLTLTFHFVATDSDGDAVRSTFSVGVDDDMPQAETRPAVQLDDREFSLLSNGSTANLTGVLATSAGADGLGRILFTEPTLGKGFSSCGCVGGTLLTIYQIQDGEEVAVITIEITDTETGAYRVTQLRAIDHPQGEDSLRIVVNYEIEDGDGDRAAGSLPIDVADDGVFAGGTIVRREVEEEGLRGGNEDTNNDPDFVIPFVNQFVDVIGASATGELNIYWGGDSRDNPGANDTYGSDVPAGRSVYFTAAPDADPATYIRVTNQAGAPVQLSDLTSNGEQLVFTLTQNGTVLTATTRDTGRPVFTVTLDDDDGLLLSGTYSFVLDGQIDHPAAGEDRLNFFFTFTAQDADGDTDSNDFEVRIIDDRPVAGSANDNQLIILDDDDVGTAGNAGGQGDDEPQFASGTLVHSFGGDAVGGSIAFTGITLPSGGNFRHGTIGDGADITVEQRQDGVWKPVLHITLDTATGVYQVEQLAAIRHADNGGNNENNRNFTLSYRVTDGDGDTANGSIELRVDDDTPVVLTPAPAPSVLSEAGPSSLDTTAEIDLAARVSFGADGAHPTDAFLLASFGNRNFAGVFSGGQQVRISSTSGVLTGKAGSDTVFTLEIVDGKAVLTMVGALDTNASGDTTLLDFSAFVTAQDADGDEVVLTAGRVAFAVADGANPVALAGTLTINEDSTANAGSVASFVTLGSDDLHPTTPFALASPTANGTITFNANGTYVYTPVANFFGTDSFTFTVMDSDGDVSAPATVTITVLNMNDAPVSQDSSASGIAEGGVRTGDLSSLFFDLDGDTVTAVLVSGPAHAATFTFNSDGTYSYTHDGSENLGDSFTYRLNDGQADSPIYTHTFLIAPVNDAPTNITPVSFATDEDTPAYLTGLSVADPDAAGGAMTVTLRVSAGLLNVASVVGGASVAGSGTAEVVLTGTRAEINATLQAAQAVRFMPAAGSSATVQLTVETNDGGNTGSGGPLTDIDTVGIAVNPVNDAPVALADAMLVAEGGSTTSLLGGANTVLANDSDEDGPSLGAVLVTGPANGQLTLNLDGTFSYQHDGSETTSDSFTYQVTDGIAVGNTVTVSISVTPVNDAPVIAAPLSLNATEDTPLPVAGLLITDPDAGNATIEVTLTVRGGSVTLGPVGNLGIYSVGSESQLDMTLTGTLADINAALAGLIFAPAPDYAGPATIRIDVDDNGHSGGPALTATSLIAIDIGNVNDAPVGVSDYYTTGEDSALSVASSGGVVANDTDADNDGLSAVLVTGPAHGTLTLNTDGSFAYTPDANFVGFDSFTYRPSDGAAAGTVTTVDILVTPVNDAPEITAPSTLDVAEGSALPIGGVSIADVDAGTGTIEVNLVVEGGRVTLAPNELGIVAIEGSGLFTLNITGALDAINQALAGLTFVPSAGFVGQASVTVTVNDRGNSGGGALSDSHTILIDVTNVNEAPVLSGPAAAATYIENAMPVFVDGSVTISDADLGDLIEGATVFISGIQQGDELVFVDMPGIVGQWNAGTGMLTLTGSASAADYQAALRTVAFRNTSDNPSDAPRSIGFSVTDGEATSNTQTVVLNVTPVNDAPTVTPSVTVSTLENTPRLVTMSVTDPDAAGFQIYVSLNVTGGTVTLAQLDGVTAPGNGSAFFSVIGTLEAVNAALNGMTFTPSAGFVGTASIALFVDDQGNFGTGGALNAQATLQVTVTNVNDVPVISGDVADTVIEDVDLSGGNLVGSGQLLISDPDQGESYFRSQEVRGSNNYGDFRLTADGEWTYAADNAHPSINAMGTGATLTDSFVAVSLDGTASQTVTVTIRGTNDAPSPVTDTSGAHDQVAEGAPIGSSVNIIARASDPEGPVAWSLSDDAGGRFAIAADGTVTTAAILDRDSALSHSITVVATDLEGLTSTATYTIVVENAPPTITSLATGQFNENIAANSVVYTAAAADPGGGIVAFGLGGPDASAFDIDAQTGVVTIKASPDFETKGSYQIVVRATDAHNGLTEKAVTLTVNDLPENTAPTVPPVTATGPEGSAAIAVVLSASDGDGTIAKFRITSLPTDGGLFFDAGGTIPVNVNAEMTPAAGGTATLYFVPNAYFYGSPSFTFLVFDDDGAQAAGTATINVTSVVIDPVVANLSGDAVDFVRGQSATLLDRGTGLTLTDPDNARYHGGRLHVEIIEGKQSSEDILTIREAGLFDVVGTVIRYNFGSPSHANWHTIAQIQSGNDGSAGRPLEIQFTNNVSRSVVEELLRELQYDNSRNGTETIGNRTVTITLTDPEGGVSVSTVTVDVQAPNTAPTVQDVAFGQLSVPFPGFQISASTLAQLSADVDGDALTYEVVSGPAFGTASFVNGNLIYTAPPLFTGAISFTYRAFDGEAYSNIATVSFTVVNIPPVAVDDIFSTAEDTALSVNASLLLANDRDADYSALEPVFGVTGVGNAVGGTVQLSGGTITFTPHANFNGQAGFDYTIADAYGATDIGRVTVDVTPVNDAPGAISDVNGNANQVTANAGIGTLVGVTAFATDPDGDTVRYLLSDDAGGRFQIDEQTGVVSLARADVSAGTYSILVRALDPQALHSQQSFSVTVNPANLPPVFATPSTSVTITEDTPSPLYPQAVGTRGAVSFTDDGPAASGGSAYVGVIATGGAVAPVGDPINHFVTYDWTPYTIDWSFEVLPGFFDHLQVGQALTYTYRLFASDNVNPNVRHDVSITITGVNDAPFGMTDTNNAANAIAAGASIGTAVGITARASDVDNATLSYSLSSNPGNRFAVDANGVVTVATTGIAAGSYGVTVRATDAGGLFTEAAFTVTVNAPTVQAAADAIGAVPVGWLHYSGNGHIYQHVSTDTRWSSALTQADALLGGAAYLATVTSQGEWDFILANSSGRISLGGSDSAEFSGLNAAIAEGTWAWIAGPEAGTVFWSGGAAVGGAFTDWSAGNPNNLSGTGEAENYLATDLGDNWNDVSVNNSLVSIGYMAEAGGAGQLYGAITEDAPFSFLGSWLLQNDTGVQGGIQSVSAFSSKGAAVSFDAQTGMITYDATTSATLQALNGGATTTDTFTYTVSNGQGGTSTAQVTVTVNGVNDAAQTAAADRLYMGPQFWEVWETNGHLYAFGVPDVGETVANEFSQLSALIGVAGAAYLATITSSAENAWILSKFSANGYGYIGASDSTTEGAWRWTAGPEASTQFWSGGVGGSSVGGNYSNWGSGEPNNAGGGAGEDFAAIVTDRNDHNYGKWVDLPSRNGPDGKFILEAGTAGSLFVKHPDGGPTTFLASILLQNDTGAPSFGGVSATTSRGASVTYDAGTGRITIDTSGVAVYDALASGQKLQDTFTYFLANGSQATVTIDLAKTVSAGQFLAFAAFAAAEPELTAIVGTEGNDRPELGGAVVGTSADEMLYGLAGDDILLGQGGSDILYGGDGNDTLVAGAGLVTMHGGSGIDVFVIDESALQELDLVDVIADYEHGVDLGVLLGAVFDGLDQPVDTADAVRAITTLETNISGDTDIVIDTNGAAENGHVVVATLTGQHQAVNILFSQADDPVEITVG